MSDRMEEAKVIHERVRHLRRLIEEMQSEIADHEMEIESLVTVLKAMLNNEGEWKE